MIESPLGFNPQRPRHSSFWLNLVTCADPTSKPFAGKTMRLASALLFSLSWF